MIKTALISLFLCLLIFILLGYYRPQAIDQALCKNNTEDQSENLISTSCSTSDVQSTDESSESISSVTISSRTTTSTIPSSSTTTDNDYDKVLVRQCFNFNYDYRIVKGVVEGSLGKYELEKLKAEIPYYENINLTSTRSPDFDAKDPNVIGDVTATQKAKEYIKAIFDYEVSEDAIPTSIIRCNFMNSTSNEYLKWNTYYSITFSKLNPSPDIRGLYYGINVDAKSGKCIGGNKGVVPSTGITYGIPAADCISNMKTRAKEFVASKRLVPDSQCVYALSELTALEDPDGYQLQTEVYLDNGYIVDVHESFKEGVVLYFNIFQSHGFKN